MQIYFHNIDVSTSLTDGFLNPDNEDNGCELCNKM